MGNYFTKFFCQNNKIEKDEGNKEPSADKANKEPSKDEAIVEGDMCTPPVIHKTLPIDPRSVTSGIDRTPIEVSSIEDEGSVLLKRAMYKMYDVDRSILLPLDSTEGRSQQSQGTYEWNHTWKRI